MSSGDGWLRADRLSKTYPRAGTPTLDELDFTAERGTFTTIVGASGAGKSTLLNILGLLDRPTSGAYRIAGADTGDMPRRDVDRLRARELGFVFQDAHIMRERLVSDNLDLALAARGTARADRERLSATHLDRVGLSNRRRSRGRDLSGGERQRLAIARALVTEPSIILADEPTGNLDPKNADTVVGLLRQAANEGAVVIMITHDMSRAESADRVLRLSEGKLS